MAPSIFEAPASWLRSTAREVKDGLHPSKCRPHVQCAISPFLSYVSSQVYCYMYFIFVKKNWCLKWPNKICCWVVEMDPLLINCRFSSPLVRSPFNRAPLSTDFSPWLIRWLISHHGEVFLIQLVTSNKTSINCVCETEKECNESFREQRKYHRGARRLLGEPVREVLILYVGLLFQTISLKSLVLSPTFSSLTSLTFQHGLIFI